MWQHAAMPPDIIALLPALIAIILLASALQAATGFGFGLLAVGVLSLFIQLTTITPLLAVLNLPVTLYLYWKLRGSVSWSGLGPIIAGMLAGIPFGIFVLVNWDQALLLRVLAVVLIVSAVRSLAMRNDSRNGAPQAAAAQDHTLIGRFRGVLVGLTTGALGGAFNTGGPPIIAYVYCRPWSKEQRTATLQAVFAISLITRMIIMALPPASLYDVPLLLTALACMPGALLGMPIGYAVFRRFPPRALELFVAGFLFLLGVKLLIWP